MKQLLSGNEAIARGAYEAGVEVASAYPGTPSTEILEVLGKCSDEVYAEWAPNEKVAVEVAYGAAIAGVRSISAMKMVGLNVAADPFFTAATMGNKGGFVVVSADDPSMHSSQNEQDNRHYARSAKVPMIEPSDSQECLDFTKAAFDISEQFDTPVLLRTTTRINHSMGLVETGERKTYDIGEYSRDIKKYVCAPANAVANHVKVEDKIEKLAEYGNTCELNEVEYNGTDVGVISSGVAYQYAREAFPDDTSFLKLGLTYPLPMGLIKEFASKVEKLYIIEELDPFMEDQIKAAGIECEGKNMTGLLYELNPQLLKERIFGEKDAAYELDATAAPRPPAFCPGCPHRGFFYTLSKNKDFVVTGDIGCYTLGMAAPLGCIDTCVCMGGGFSVGMGMAKAFAKKGITDKKVFGVVGDSTFFHSGMTGAAEIAYNNGNLIPCVLDNHITAMTGHQDNPGSGYTLNGEVAESISIEKVLEAYGFKNIIIVDPQDLTAMQKAVDDALASDVPAAIISRRPCVLLKRANIEKGLCKVDPDKCKSCKMCLKVGCPAIGFTDGKSVIDPNQCIGCTVCAQVCPFDAISKEDR